MYNFNAHTLNGLPVNYSTMPNFALDTVETDTRLNATAKLIYIRLLRYATLIRKVNFKITASWLSDNLAIDRNTVSRALKSLKEHGYMNDDGIILVTGNHVDSPVTLVNDTALRPVTNDAPKAPKQDNLSDADIAQSAISAMFETLGIRRKAPVLTTEKGESTTVGDATEYSNQPENNATKYSISANDHVQNTASNAENCTSECYKIQHPIKNKGKNKEKNDCTTAQNQPARTSGKGFDRLQETSNQHKAESVTDLITVTKTSNGKISLSINPTLNRHTNQSQGGITR